jgi:hypothetical protein
MPKIKTLTTGEHVFISDSGKFYVFTFYQTKNKNKNYAVLKLRDAFEIYGWGDSYKNHISKKDVSDHNIEWDLKKLKPILRNWSYVGLL